MDRTRECGRSVIGRTRRQANMAARPQQPVIYFVQLDPFRLDTLSLPFVPDDHNHVRPDRLVISVHSSSLQQVVATYKCKESIGQSIYLNKSVPKTRNQARQEQRDKQMTSPTVNTRNLDNAAEAKAFSVSSFPSIDTSAECPVKQAKDHPVPAQTQSTTPHVISKLVNKAEKSVSTAQRESTNAKSVTAAPVPLQVSCMTQQQQLQRGEGTHYRLSVERHSIAFAESILASIGLEENDDSDDDTSSTCAETISLESDEDWHL